MYSSTSPVSLVLPPPPGIGVSIGGGLVGRLAGEIVHGWFQSAVQVVASLAQWAMTETWRSLSASTEPVLSGSAFNPEFHVMAIVAASVILPMLFIGIVQSIVRQDGGSFLRSALIRMPFALVFTNVVVGLVSVCLSATDQASAALLSAAGHPARRLFTTLATQIVSPNVAQQGIGAALLVAGTMAIVAFVLWVELAVRSAAVAAATLFLPLALAGLAWPATTHWARRLGETIAALVLMKLVIAGVLALAAAALGSLGGIAQIVEGIALLGLATFTPFALLRLIPMIESGAVAHLEGAHHRATGAAAGLARKDTSGWLASAGAFASQAAPLGTEDRSPARAPHKPGLRPPADGAGGSTGVDAGSPGADRGSAGSAGGSAGSPSRAAGPTGGSHGGAAAPAGGAAGRGSGEPGTADTFPGANKYEAEIESYKQERDGAA